MFGALPAFLFLVAQRAPEAPVAPPPDARAVVERELANVRKLVDRRDWSAAAKSLIEFLKKHEGEDLVRGKRFEIEDLTRQASFWSRHPPPDPKDLVGGELERFDRTSDAITLRYPSGKSAQKLKDRAQARWQRPKVSIPILSSEKAPGGAAPFPDFDRQDALVLHPLQWNGPYSVEIRAHVASEHDPAPVVVLVLDDDELLIAHLGAECVLEHVSGSREEVLERKGPAPFEIGRPYRLTVQVNEKTASFQLNGKVLLTGAKPSGSYGWFGFAFVRGIDGIVMKGKSYGQWIDALVDAAAAGDRERFEKGFEPEAELPAWLLEIRPPPPRDSDGEKAARELVQRGVKLEKVKEIDERLSQSRPADALGYLDELPNDDVKPLTRSWLRAGLLMVLGRLAEARTELSNVSEQAPLHRDVRRALARLALRLEPGPGALHEVERVVHDFPDDAPAREMLVGAWMQRGDLPRALEEAERALLDGVDASEARKLVRRVRRALDGPYFRAPQSFESKHFLVTSDMDRDTCAQIARVLEEGCEVFARVLGPLDDARARMQAFVFSGQAGYRSYCADLTGDARASTQGLFDPSAEQLLLWSAVDRAEFTRTARHEGFHQYLHALVPEVPTWLNEGLAQYFETLRKEKSQWVQGDVPAGAQESLGAVARLPDLDGLFRMSPATFYGEGARYWYACSWCVVHTLAHGTQADRAVFEGLLARLGRGVDGEVAVQEAFAGVDLGALLARVRTHAQEILRR